MHLISDKVRKVMYNEIYSCLLTANVKYVTKNVLSNRIV